MEMYTKQTRNKKKFIKKTEDGDTIGSRIKNKLG